MKLKIFTPFELTIWLVGIAAMAVSFIVFKNSQIYYLIGSILGVTSILFCSKANPIGPFLVIIFSVFYGVISFSFKYYGEMITYLGMTAPMEIYALYTWIKNPSKEGKNVVKVNKISIKEWGILVLISSLVTIAFYFVLKALNTNNLIISTISVLTSFVAVYLTARRSKYYALFYAFNDVVLVVMWSLAAIENLVYIPIAICFSIFIFNDVYGLYNWSRLEKKQKNE